MCCQRIAYALPTCCEHVAHMLSMISQDKINVVNALPTCCQRIAQALTTTCWLNVAPCCQLVVTVHGICRVGEGEEEVIRGNRGGG